MVACLLLKKEIKLISNFLKGKLRICRILTNKGMILYKKKWILLVHFF
jgi:hypothetical protein